MKTRREAESELDKKEAGQAIKNYTRTPNMLVDGYRDLHPQEKWLFVCLCRLCGKEGTRYLTLRYIAQRTGFSLGPLSSSKSSPGMIRRLHDAGLIHAEKARRTNAEGKEVGNALFRITIMDRWELNNAFFEEQTCSELEQVCREESQPVLIPNRLVRNQNRSAETRSESEQTCSNSEQAESCEEPSHRRVEGQKSAVILQSNMTDSRNKMTIEKNPRALASANDMPSSTPLPLEEFTPDEVAVAVETIRELRHQRITMQPPHTAMKVSTRHFSSSQATPGAGSGRNNQATSGVASGGQAKGRTHKRTTPKREGALALHGQHIIELYQVFKGRKVVLTEDTVTAANHLGEFIGRDEDFSEVLKAIAADDFLRKKKVRWDLDYVYRHYDEFFDIVERNRGNQPPGATGDETKTDYNAVMGMTDEQRAEYARRQREKQRSTGMDRETLMKMPPQERIAYLRHLREQQHPAVVATSA